MKTNYIFRLIAVLIVALGSVYMLTAFVQPAFKTAEAANAAPEPAIQSEPSVYDQLTSDFFALDTAAVEEKISNHDAFFLYVGRSTCEWCRKLVPMLHEVAADNAVDIFYLDSENSMINVALQTFRNEHGIDLVPAVLFFDKDGGYVKLDFDITAEAFDREELSTLMEPYFSGEKQ